MRIHVDTKTGERQIRLDKTEVRWLKAADVCMRQLKQLGVNGSLEELIESLGEDGVLRDGESND